MTFSLLFLDLDHSLFFVKHIIEGFSIQMIVLEPAHINIYTAEDLKK